MLWVWRPDFSARSLAAQSTRCLHHFCGCCAFCATTVAGIGLFRHCHFQSFDSSIYLTTFAAAAWRLQADFRRHRFPQSLRFCFSRPHSADPTFFSHFKRIISPITRDRAVCRWVGLSIQSSLGSLVPFMHNKLLFSFSWHFTTHSGTFLIACFSCLPDSNWVVKTFENHTGVIKKLIYSRSQLDATRLSTTRAVKNFEWKILTLREKFFAMLTARRSNENWAQM